MSALNIDEAIRERINTALDSQKTLTAAYVDKDGKPHISFYGSTHFHDGDTLAIWIRNANNALMQTIDSRPDMAFIYGDISSTVYCTLEGRARVVTDEAIRTQVYENMHAIERRFDAEKGGVAVLIDLDRVTVLSKAGKQVFAR